jgi:cyclohexa-1,5-dienecarbonyl-CoA hydratase
MATTPQAGYRKIALGGIAPVCRITLTNPPVNVIDVPMMEELARALSDIEQRADIAVVVLTGSERAFSAGVDIAAHTPERVGEMLAKFHAVIACCSAPGR